MSSNTVFIFCCCFKTLLYATMYLTFVLFFTFVNLSKSHLTNNMNKFGVGNPAGVQYSSIPDVEYYTQKLDHFDPTNLNTWQQRYWKNTAYRKVGGPVFLMINGEAACDGSWVTKGQWISYAKENNALCFLVEHRFYGGSRPLNDTSSQNLKYLSSEQALADLAYFIEGMNEKFAFDSDTKWIVFGGSYAGSLAAWLRIKYPYLVHGSISSSAPLLAKIDFYEYFQVVQQSLAWYAPECPYQVLRANKQLSDLVATKSGRSKIEKLFRLCEPLDDDQDDIANLFENLSGNFADVVQYNGDNRESSTKNVTIDVLCDIMMGKNERFSQKSSLDRYADVNTLSLKISNQTCVAHKYKNYIEDLQKADYESAARTNRQWIYQTCTEFGYYQSSSKPDDIFGSYFPVEFFTKQCEAIFGSRFTDELLENAVRRTNILYGALNVNVGNIVFVHGSVDPWHALGLWKYSAESSFETVFIEGTAHCADMYPSSAEDINTLRSARKRIKKIIRAWLSPEALLRTNSSTKKTWKIVMKLTPVTRRNYLNFV